MPARSHYYVLPFHKSGEQAKATIDHLIECVSETEAVARAEQMSTYPEYVGAIAVTMRRRDGAPHGALVLNATFGVFQADLADIRQSIVAAASF